MILKIQLSVTTSADERQALVYNESKDFLVQSRASSFVGLEDLMGDRLRAYFEAEIVNDSEGKPCLAIGKMLPDQEW